MNLNIIINNSKPDAMSHDYMHLDKDATALNNYLFNHTVDFYNAPKDSFLEDMLEKYHLKGLKIAFSRRNIDPQYLFIYEKNAYIFPFVKAQKKIEYSKQ